jgi:hypothetical protein
MSEENPSTVTNPVKTHVKDSKKVEAGRRLAKISQEAKARKRAQREATKEEQNVLDAENKCEVSVITLERVGIYMVVGITVGSDPSTLCGAIVGKRAKRWRKANPRKNRNPHQNRRVVLTCLTETDPNIKVSAIIKTQ